MGREHRAVCERAYPMINEELKSDGFKPPRRISMALKKSYRGVAHASGDRIVGSLSYFKQHRDDVGAMVHETTHVVQHYRGDNPGWLVEGVSDYVRFFKFEPGKIGKINAERAHYNGSYRVTAAFLAFVADKYDKVLVTKLNKRMREGHYKDEIFHELTGKSLHELDEEWRAAPQAMTSSYPPGDSPPQARSVPAQDVAVPIVKIPQQPHHHHRHPDRHEAAHQAGGHVSPRKSRRGARTQAQTPPTASPRAESNKQAKQHERTS